MFENHALLCATVLVYTCGNQSLEAIEFFFFFREMNLKNDRAEFQEFNLGDFNSLAYHFEMCEHNNVAWHHASRQDLYRQDKRVLKIDLS